MQDYDVVVVGGGIQGAAVAQAAAVRGWSVLLLEQHGRVGQGTSSRSSKLIHGGLRYLETGQFRLVRECLRERRLLLHNAPELVKLRDFYIPIYDSTCRRPWQIRVGLSLYAMLSGLRREGLFSKIPCREWDRLEGLKHDGLKAVYRYQDAQTDDAALTTAVVASGKSLGVQVSTGSRLIHADLVDAGVDIRFDRDGQEQSCNASVLVNAGGPWVNQVLSCVRPAVKPVPIELVQGTHIVLPGPGVEGIYYVEAPLDGRAVFVMPWHGQTLVGTTETRYKGDPAAVAPLPDEIQYLLETHGHYFPEHRCDQADVVEAFAGLRVLPVGKGSAFFRPRETRLHTDRDRCPRVVSLYGGKLTAYRAMGERVVNRISQSLPHRPKADTRSLRLAPSSSSSGE